MPNKNKLKSNKKALDEALFREDSYSLSDKASKILTNSQSVLTEATVDFFNYFFSGKVEEANPRDLYDLSKFGSEIYPDCQEEVAKNPEFLDRLLKLAALCFPYSPSPIPNNLYFCLKENYRANEPQKQTSYLVKYFGFLNYLLTEESISANFRLACLCGAMKFYENNSDYLTYAFVIKLLLLLDFPEIKKLLALYKNTAVSESDFVDSYSPNYSVLFTQSDEFLLETGIEDIASWRETTQRVLNDKTNLDKDFIREHKLSPIALFELELKKIINQFPTFIKKCDRKKQQEFIEKVSIFFNEQHPLAVFFSEENFRKEISIIRSENEEFVEKNQGKLLAEEQARDKRKDKNKQQKEKKKEKKALLAADREKEEALKAKQAKIEKEFSKLSEYIHKLSATLTRSTGYIKEIVETSKVKSENKVGIKTIESLVEKFKSEYGKLHSEIEIVCSLLELEKNTHISNFLNRIKDIISKQEKFTETQSDSLLKKINEIEEVLIKVEGHKNELVNSLKKLISLVYKLDGKVVAIYGNFAKSQKLSHEEMQKFNECKKEIEKLAREFKPLSVAYRQYTAIFPISEELTGIDVIGTKITSLKKLFFELNRDVEANAKAKQTAAKKEKPPERAGGFVISTEYQEYIDREEDFKKRFFNTLEVIHRLPYITFAQGGKELVAIFLRKLTAYEKEISREEKNLSDWKASLSAKSRNRFHFVLREAKGELTYHGKLIADLKLLLETYGLETIEFTHRELCWKSNFNQQFRNFEAFFPQLTELENDCINLRRLLVRAGTKGTNAEAKEGYLKEKKCLEEKREILGKYNKTFQNLFEEQLPQVLASQPLPVPVVPVQVLVPVAPVLVSQTFFSLPVTTQNPTFNPQVSSEASTQETARKTLPKKS